MLNSSRSTFHKIFIKAALAFYLSEDKYRWKEILIEGNTGMGNSLLTHLITIDRDKFHLVLCKYLDNL